MKTESLTCPMRIGTIGRGFGPAFILLIVFQVALILLVPTLPKSPLLLAIPLGVVFLVLTAFSAERVLLLLIVYMCVFPLTNFLPAFPGLSIGYTSKVGFPLFVLVLFYWLIRLSLRRQEIRLTSMDRILLVFLVSVLISACLGLARGHPFLFWRLELVPLAFYLVYFVIVISSPPKRMFRVFFDIILFSSIIVAFEIIYALYCVKGVFLARIATRHVHLAQLSIPYIGTVLIFSPSKRRKVLSAFLSLPLVIMVIITQQRALWGSIFISISFLFVLALSRMRFFGKKLFWVVVAAILVVSLLSGSLLILKKLTGAPIGFALIKRALVFLKPGAVLVDPAALMRVEATKSVLASIGGEILVGRGLGDFYYSRMIYDSAFFVDNSYLQLLWKMGIFGLVAYLGLSILFLRRCLFLFRHTDAVEEKIWSMTAFVNFLGLLIIASTNSSLVCYRFTLIWAITFGIVEVLARDKMRLDRNKYQG